MAKCAECGKVVQGSKFEEADCNIELMKRGFCECRETGKEPQEVAKVELTEEQREDLAGANEQDHLRTRCYEEIERIINTAVLAERDRIMAVLPWPYEADNDQGFIDDEEIGYNRCLTEVKKIIGGQS